MKSAGFSPCAMFVLLQFNFVSSLKGPLRWAFSSYWIPPMKPGAT